MLPLNPKTLATSMRMLKGGLSDKTVQSATRRLYEKLAISSYLNACIDSGQLDRAYDALKKYGDIRTPVSRLADVKHFNIVLKGCARANSFAKFVETRMYMIKNNIEPNLETFACILLNSTKSQSKPQSQQSIRKIYKEMKQRDFDPTKLFQSTYLTIEERAAITKLLRQVNSRYEDEFLPIPISYNCKLLENLEEIPTKSRIYKPLTDPSKIAYWVDYQRQIEWKPSIPIKSIAKGHGTPEMCERYAKLWDKLREQWRVALRKSLAQTMECLKDQVVEPNRIHIYPYICSIDKDLTVELMLDEIESLASLTTFSSSTHSLHLQLGTKLMTRYMKIRSCREGSYDERQRAFDEYINEYSCDPEMMSKMNPREYIQRKAIETKNYAIYSDIISPCDRWPSSIVVEIGKILYGLILRDIQFDPQLLGKPTREIKSNNLVNAFYTAYFQVSSSYKIKEEFRAHPAFEKLFRRATTFKLRFDYSFLPTSCPPMPWISFGLGGYLSMRHNLIRVANSCAEQNYSLTKDVDPQKMYPSLDSLNVIGGCPWVVNKPILDILIKLFRSGGDLNLSVPLDDDSMSSKAPTLKEDASKADKIMFAKEKKKFDQKRSEMYSIWRNCLYCLSIANHFKSRTFWFPHNMDFRGRTYPIPPHFNHLNADLARSLLMFAEGRPLGDHGLDWLKIHLINLTGTKKKLSKQERLDYANSVLPDILDSADNPLGGNRWWTKAEDAWQALACCKEIAKAIRSKHPQQYICHLPIHQDGSCNGLQHYAALGRDPAGALAVNLLPSDRPQDVYSRVVDIVEDLRRKDAEQGNRCAKMLEGFIQRKVIKQTVMTTVYGVTRYGARNQIARQLAAKNYSEQEVWQAAQYLTTITFESVGNLFNKSRLIQSWLNNCAFAIATKYRQPVCWETPLGFPVTQPYLASPERGLSIQFCGLPGGSKDAFFKVNASKQKTAFPPNYIHSLDSSHMMLTSLHCQRHNITFVSVHDCFWTHPSTVDEMNRICREQFVALHSQPLLYDLSRQFLERYGRLDDQMAAARDESSLDLLVEKRSRKSSKSKTSSTKTTPKMSSPGRVDEVADTDWLPPPMIDDLADCSLPSFEGLMEPGVEFGANDDTSTKPLIVMYDTARKASIGKTQAMFRDIPLQGELDLEQVLKSTYFFS